MGAAMKSRAWEVANEVRDQEEECYAALESAVEAQQVLQEHLDRVTRVDAPTKPPATSISGEWYHTYQRLSKTRETAFRTFEKCVERVSARTP